MVSVVGLPGPLGEEVARVLEERATMDVTVAGAGETRAAPFLALTQSDWESVIEGVKKAFLAAQSAARSLAERGEPGRIVLVSSAAAVRPVHGATLAATAGAFLTTLAQVAAVELGPARITVNVVAPGFVGDSRFDDAVPVGRVAEPRDVAEVCAFLASEAAAYVTGAVVTVDGGFSITKSPGGSPLLRPA
jgi:NAD(P)-dependent dehydrogenase (short-subunit alcohol dehydrogenase family)